MFSASVSVRLRRYICCTPNLYRSKTQSLISRHVRQKARLSVTALKPNKYGGFERTFGALGNFQNLEKIGFDCSNRYLSSCSLSNIQEECNHQHVSLGQSELSSDVLNLESIHSSNTAVEITSLQNRSRSRSSASLQNHKTSLSIFHSGPFQYLDLSLGRKHRGTHADAIEYGMTVPVRNFATSFHASARYRTYSLISSRPRFVETQSCKRHGGEQKRNQHDDNDVNSSSLINETAKQTNYFNHRMSNIRLRLLDQNKNIKEKINIHRSKGERAVRGLRRKLQAQVAQKEDIKTIPNLLTTLRMASAPALAYLVLNDHFGWALSIFVVAGFTDLLDGYIARNFENQRTALGTALDPLADKLLISCLTLSLTSAGLIPVPLTVLILSRDAGLIIASFIIRYKSLSAPRTLSRYFDVTHVTAKLFPSRISKINTGIQLSYVACVLASPVFGFVEHPLLQALMYTTAATTFLSGADYVITWRRRLKIIKNK